MIFIDCEFTSVESPELLSVGLVADNGRELYFELIGQSHFIGASTFVLDTVVPQFGLMPHAVATLEELGRHVGEWLLEFFEQPIDVAYDYHTDFDLLERALRSAGLWERLKEIIRPTHIGYLIGQDAVKASMEMSWAASRIADGIDRHHALADARALLAGFLAMHGEQTKPAGFVAAIDLLADADKSAADHSAASMAERLNALPKMGPFWTVEQYAKLDFLIWELEPEMPPLGRRMKHGRMQTQFRKDYGYVLASREVMDTMAELLRNAGSLLEVGSGSGYLSKELARLGISTFAVDYVDYTLPDNGYPIDAVYQRDAQGDAVPFVSKGFGAVLMTWPPHDRPFALRVAKAMLPGQLLIYGGENAGGCTANQAFFD